MLNNVSKKIQPWGSNVRVFITGHPDEVEREFNRFYNWGGTPANAELEWLSPVQAVFQTKMIRVKSCLKAFYVTMGFSSTQSNRLAAQEVSKMCESNP